MSNICPRSVFQYLTVVVTSSLVCLRKGQRVAFLLLHWDTRISYHENAAWSALSYVPLKHFNKMKIVSVRDEGNAFMDQCNRFIGLWTQSSLEGATNIYDVLERLILHRLCKLVESCVKIHTVRQVPPGYAHKVAQEHKLFLLRSIIIYAILLLCLLFWGRRI